MPLPAAVTTRVAKTEKLERRVPFTGAPTKREVNGKERNVFRVSFSSELPVIRYDYETGDLFMEVLGHGPGEIDLERASQGLAVLEHHNWRGQVGIADNIERVDTPALEADVMFSSVDRGPIVETDVLERVRRFVSVSYFPEEYEVIEPGDRKTGKLEVRRCTKWEPIELSFVAVPADYTVGPKRDRGEEPELREVIVKTKDGGAVVEERVMPEKKEGEATERVTVVPNGGEAAAKRAEEIADLCASQGCPERTAHFLRTGLNVDQVARELLTARSTGVGTAVVRATPGVEAIDTGSKAQPAYSFQRALLCALQMRESGKVDPCYELDVHNELTRRRPDCVSDNQGFKVPLRDPNSKRSGLPPLIARTMGSSLAGTGAETVFTQSGDLIDLLANKAMVIRRGAEVMPGLTAPLQFPKINSDPTVYWRGENPGSDVTPSDMATGMAGLNPKTLTGQWLVPKQLLRLAGIDWEARARVGFARAHGLAIDRAAMHGTGGEYQPMGLYNVSGVQPLAYGGAASYSKLVDQTALSANANAGDLDSLGWIMSILQAGRLRRTLVASSSGSAFIWQGSYDEGDVAGFGASATKQVAENLGAGANEEGIMFGPWRLCKIGFWGDLEILVNPYALDGQGIVKITSFQMGDVLFTRPEAFTKGTGATLAA